MQDLLKRYYNNNIQIHINVINDILQECKRKPTKMLVFGLGNDSILWYNATNKNTIFVEDDINYINFTNIPQDNIIKYNYSDITVSKSMNLTIGDIEKYKIPDKLIELSPFDIIIIDGPKGYRDNHPGRLLPIYWSKYYLSKPGTILYIDDSKRLLESNCINRFLIANKVKYFHERDGCDKCIV